jgi:hypothetical protein
MILISLNWTSRKPSRFCLTTLTFATLWATRTYPFYSQIGLAENFEQITRKGFLSFSLPIVLGHSIEMD